MAKNVLLIAACLLLSVAAAQAAPRVAVVYSAWSNSSFQTEYDAHLQALGWPFEKLENKEVARWIGRLDEFDLVIATSVANFENPQQMAPHKDAWLRFLSRGGGLLITDASYGTVLDLWLNTLGPDWALTSTGCAPHTKKNGGSDAITCDAGHPLLHVPHDLPPLLRAKAGIWAHLESWGAGWTNLVTCADGKSLLATRTVGKGTAVVTNYFSMRGEVARPAATALLDNLWTYVQGLRAGVAITNFYSGPAQPGERKVTLGIGNVTDAPATYDVALTLAAGGGAPAPVCNASTSVQPGATAQLSLGFRSEQRGPVRLKAEISSAGKPVMALERAETIPPMISFRPRDRHLYPWRKELAYSAAFVPDAGVSLAECAADLLVDGKSIQRLAPPRPEGDYTVDTSRLPVGRHQTTLRLSRAGKVLGSVESDFYRHATPRVYSRPDGTTMVAGKPFFPFGWYHVSWTFTAEERLAFVRDVAAGGFNTVHAGIKQLEEWEPFLDEAAKGGVYVVTEFGVDAEKVITRYRDKPAVLAWNPGDEPDGGGVSPDEMLARYDRFKVADPEHPTYLTLCVPQTYARYVGCAEVIAPDPYPIPHAPTSMVYDLLSAASTEAAKYGRPVWGVLQCFGYEKGPWRVPTFAECRNMTYLALLAGVKGVIYYTYADNGFRVTQHPALWSEMKTLPAEMKALEPALLNGRLTKLETGAPDVFAGTWRVGKRTIACVVNASAKEAREVSLALPAGAKGGVRALFAGRPAGMSVRGGRLSGTVGPLDVHVYEAAME